MMGTMENGKASMMATKPKTVKVNDVADAINAIRILWYLDTYEFASGTDIKRVMWDNFHSNHSAILETLGKCYNSGLVNRKLEHDAMSNSSKQKYIYFLTDKGKEALDKRRSRIKRAFF